MAQHGQYHPDPLKNEQLEAINVKMMALAGSSLSDQEFMIEYMKLDREWKRIERSKSRDS